MTITEHQISGGKTYRTAFRVSVISGESEIIKSPPFPCSINCIPGGNTGNVYATNSSEAAIAGDTATWVAWSLGAVTSSSADCLLAPVTALKFTATGGTVVFEVAT